MTAVETSAITWGETRVAYAIRRSARRKKTVAVTVDPTGSVLLVAPEHLTTRRLDAIVSRKAGWIVRRIRRAESHGPPLSPREFVSGESVRYLGRHYRLKVHPHETGDAKLRGGWLYVPAPAGPRQTAEVCDAIVAWFRHRAAERLPERVAAWRPKAGVAMPRVVIANQQKRWGSCDQRGTIRLNWRIIQAPLRLVDYVVAHGTSAPAAPRPRPRLLAGPRPRHAGLRAPPRGLEAAWRGTGVVVVVLRPCPRWGTL